MTPRSGRAVEWKVKVWTDAGESDWSEPSAWEHGLLETVGLERPVDRADRGRRLPARQRPVHQLAGAFRIDGEVDALGCTPPPTASTRRSSTAPGSATSS